MGANTATTNFITTHHSIFSTVLHILDNIKLLSKSPMILVKTEGRQTGTVESTTYRAYVKAAGG